MSEVDAEIAPEEMSRADLIKRIEKLESLLEDVRSNAGKDRAGIHKRITEVADDLDERFDAVEERLDSLEGHVTNADQAGQRPSTKKEVAESIIQSEAVRVANKGIRGGAIDYPTIRDIAERQSETVLNSGTVYTAFDDLAAKWECFEVQNGGDGPNTQNKHLRVERETIPPALENLAGSSDQDSVRRGGN